MDVRTRETLAVKQSACYGPNRVGHPSCERFVFGFKFEKRGRDLLEELGGMVICDEALITQT